MRKISSTGTQDWEITEPNQISSIEIDSQDNIIYTSGGNITKIDSEKTVIWEEPYKNFNSGGSLGNIAIDKDDNIYVTGYRNKYIQKLNSEGDFIWKHQFTNSNDLMGVAVGENYNIIGVSGDIIKKIQQR